MKNTRSMLLSRLLWLAWVGIPGLIYAQLVPPTVSTLPARVAGANATLNGNVNPSDFLTFGFFQWGTTTNYGNTTPAQSLGNGGSNTNFSHAVGGLLGGVTYHFRAVASNSYVVTGTNQSFTTLVFTNVVSGYLTKLRFDNIGNSVNVEDLLNHPKYINDQYDFTSLRTDFSANDADECDACGYTVRGLFIPTATGAHRFYLAADDGAVLFLSTDESRANKIQIAREPVWSVRRNYIGEAEGGARGDPPANISAPISLTAGARYYIEGLVKEGTGWDNLDVAVQGPGDADVADGDRPIFGHRIATTVDLPRVGYALDFDGDDDRVQAEAKAFSNVVNSFTIELWVNPTGGRTSTAQTNNGISDIKQRFAVFPDHGDSYGANHACAGLSIGTNGISVFEHAVNYLPSVLVYPTNLSGWTHVALVYANRQPRIYVNGALALAHTGLTSSKSSVHPSASLGGSIHAPDYGPFQGQLDEVRIWNEPLSQAQIQANMSRSLTGSEMGLAVYYRCDEGPPGTLLTDHAPAEPVVHGALENGVVFVPSGVHPLTCSYTVTIVPGWNLIANQCANATDVGTLMPAVPAGTRLLKFNNGSQSYEMFNRFNGTFWTFPSQTLGLGEGAWIHNPGPSPFTLAFRGTAAGGALQALGTGGCYMVSRQVAAPGHYADIVAGAPRPGTTIYNFDPSAQNYTLVSQFDDLDNAWWPPLLPAEVGEALWICLPGGGTPPVLPTQCAATITPDVGTVTIAWPCAGCHLERAPALLTPSATTKWTFVPGSSPAVLPATGSAMFYQVVCP